MAGTGQGTAQGLSAGDAGLLTCDLFIGGKRVPAEGGRDVETVEAVTGEPIARVAAASVSDARAAATAAGGALEEWSALPPASSPRPPDGTSSAWCWN